MGTMSRGMESWEQTPARAAQWAQSSKKPEGPGCFAAASKRPKVKGGDRARTGGAPGMDAYGGGGEQRTTPGSLAAPAFPPA